MQDDNYLEELNQIRDSQVDVIDAIDKIKRSRKGEELPELNKIQSDALAIVYEIDEIRERVQNEQNTRAARDEKSWQMLPASNMTTTENGVGKFFCP
jgi:hypothetical protein